MKNCTFLWILIITYFKSASPTLSTFTELAQAVLSAKIDVYNTVSNFLEAIKNPPSFDDSLQIYCANPATKIFQRVYLDDPDVESKIDFNTDLGFLIHGWNDWGTSDWMVATANEWIAYRHENVCRVSWKMLAGNEYIRASTRNTRIVADYLHEFIRFLEESGGMQPDYITMVGHSLGAHISGFVGARFGGQLYKIVGLDPAGPLFTIPITMHNDMRLDSSDAQQVIIIHSCDGLVGVTIPCGHQDFFLNMGFFPQKGCFWPNFRDTYASEPITCSHFRSADFFRKSLNPNYGCRAVKCDNLFAYIARKCSSTTNIVGIDAENIKGNYYFASETSVDCSQDFY